MTSHEGHRARLREKYIETGIDGFNDINILELLLCYAIPRKDTNPTAHELLDRFKSLKNVLSASPKELMTVEGVGESAAVLLSLVSQIMKKAEISESRNIKQLNNSKAIFDYISPYFMYQQDEEFYAIFLDSQLKIITVEKLSSGVVNAVNVDVRMIAEHALRNRATFVALSHNHPDGVCTPSGEDIAVTKNVKSSLELVGITLIDHIIVSGDKYSSLAEYNVI